MLLPMPLRSLLLTTRSGFNAFGLPGLAFPLVSRYASPKIPPYIGFGCHERHEPGFMPPVLHTWLATLMRNRDRSDNVVMLDRDVHMAAKVAALDDPPHVCSLQWTKSKPSDWAGSYHQEVTQRAQAEG